MKVVVSIGGNALGETPQEQMDALYGAVRPIADLIAAGHTVALVHGNGPQVGAIHLAMEHAHNQGQPVPAMPLPECVAMTQGYIGYHVQNILGEELRRRGMERMPVTVVTHVEVDPADPAFDDPAKPVGSFYSLREKEQLEREKGYVLKEDAGRGYRRMVPSPHPHNIVEKDIILRLIEEGYPVIACGGGGIPVVRKENRLEGTAAVVDKDYASAVLAKELDADAMFLLTGVDQVAINWGRPDQKWLARADVPQMETYIAQKQFAPGSMLPKVEASLEFVRGRPGKRAFITSLPNLSVALRGEGGTEIVCPA
ncbi:MAG: carbamate kinase [Oscillibacter sp.]|nr:carbamate kinase [Oscillibacter sp.]